MQSKKIISTTLLTLACLCSLLPTVHAEIVNITETATSQETNKEAQERAAALATIQTIKMATIYVESLANTYDSILPDALVNTTAAILVKDKMTVDVKKEKPKGAAKQITATATVAIDTDQIPDLIEFLQNKSEYTIEYNAILNRYKNLQEEGTALDEQNQSDLKCQAKDDLKKARKSNAKALAAAAYLEKGLQAQNKKDLDEAVALFSKAIRMNKQDDLAYDLRGNAYSALGEYKDALEDYDKALELNPDEQTYKDKQKVAQAKIGDKQ